MKALANMIGPYRLPILESCFACVLHEEGLFCRLTPEATKHLNSLRQTSMYPAGALLFVEGQKPRGLFILCQGRAKLSASSRDGKSITLRTAEAGQVLGLSSLIANTPYPVSAETQVPTEVSSIPREQFFQCMQAHADVAVRVAEHLSMELHKAWEQTRMLALAPSAGAKLAQLLLNLAEEHGQSAGEGVRVPLNMTQTAIGESIGATRETVSRLLADFKRQGLIRVKGGAVILLQPDHLRRLSSD